MSFVKFTQKVSSFIVKFSFVLIAVFVLQHVLVPAKANAQTIYEWSDPARPPVYPQFVLDFFNFNCLSGQKAVTTTWLSDANDPGQISGSIVDPTPGASVTLMLNVATKRCTAANTDIIGDVFRPKQGTSTLTGHGPVSIGVLTPSPINASDISKGPPGAFTPPYTRGGWIFTVDLSQAVADNVSSTDIDIAASSKQYSVLHEEDGTPSGHNEIHCIMPFPQTELASVNDFENPYGPSDPLPHGCPEAQVGYRYTVTFNRTKPKVTIGVDANCSSVTLTGTDQAGSNTFDYAADFYQGGVLVGTVGENNHNGGTWSYSPLPSGLDTSDPFDYTGWVKVRGGKNDGQLNSATGRYDGCPKPVTLSTSPTVVLHDGENPVSVDFGATISGNEQVNGLPVSHSFYVKRNGAIFKTYQTATNTPESLVFDSGSGTYISTHPLSPPFGFVPQPGDEFCSSVQVQSGYGTITVNNAGTILTHSGNTLPNEVCRTFANAPYVSVFGGDVRAGIGFTDSMGACTTTTADIKGSLSVATGLGAGTQLAAFALGTINDFNTASLTTNKPDGLAFANIGAGTPGNFGGFSGCIPHYYGGAQGPAVSNNLDVGTLTDGSHQYTGALTISGGAISAGKHIYLYVKGDVTIDGAITLASTAIDRDNIPSFYLMVTDGSIKIKNAVRQLDGVYIAEPSAVVNSGTIYTCVKASGAPYGPGEVDLLYPECFNQLIVNGSFMAKTVKLLRTFGSLRNASATEYSGGAPHSCVANSNSPVATTTASVCAGEVFNFSPYTYVAQAPSAGPASNTPGAPSSSGYEYIASLPPLL